jgi:D-glycero-D-manno-heptose 1,7-bisphosphate phosphatase
VRRKAAFIDRDGVINEERAYVGSPQDFVLLPGALSGLQRLQAAGYRLIVITNQSGIARGFYTEADYLQLEAHMQELLAQGGVTLDLVQYCPHLPDAPLERYRMDCECRKPRPGMLRRAAEMLDLDLQLSFLVGDRLADIQAGRAAGVGRCYLVRSGQALSAPDIAAADGVFGDLDECVADVLSSLAAEGSTA